MSFYVHVLRVFLEPEELQSCKHSRFFNRFQNKSGLRDNKDIIMLD